MVPIPLSFSLHSGLYARDSSLQALNERQQEILKLTRMAGRVMVDDLAARFMVTPQTIRKDLNGLCERRFLSRVHGGAVILGDRRASEEQNFFSHRVKAALGIATAKHIPNQASLFINIGTTAEEVAKALGQHENLLVITNNIKVAELLYSNPNLDVIIAGGPIRQTDGAVVGETTAQLLHQFKVDYAIIGASAIDGEGTLLGFDYREAPVARAVVENARQVILVADRQKFDRKAPVRMGHLSEIDLLVTDRLPEKKIIEICRLHSVRVETVEKPETAELATSS